MKDNRHVVARVKPGSIAEEMEIEKGDAILAVNDKPIEDIFLQLESNNSKPEIFSESLSFLKN